MESAGFCTFAVPTCARELHPPPARRLCKVKYFNNCLFYNVQRGFIAQSGDPTNSGKGGQSIWGVLYGEQVGLSLGGGGARARCGSWQPAGNLGPVRPSWVHAPRRRRLLQGARPLGCTGRCVDITDMRRRPAPGCRRAFSRMRSGPT